jgi:hypothetical protein
MYERWLPKGESRLLIGFHERLSISDATEKQLYPPEVYCSKSRAVTHLILHQPASH